jgi:type II secretory pathway pseudopilin PulG
MFSRQRRFNMVEVLLALGVVAIGAVSVLALFPYGFASSRDSVAESFAGDSADQFLHWFAAQTRTNWTAWAGDSTWLPAVKPADPSGPTYMESNNWAPPDSVTPNLQYERNTAEAGTVRVAFKRGNIPDFSGVYRMWYGSVTVSAGGSSFTMDTDSALAINLEASWPAEIRYDRRQKRVYRIEVFKPTPP